MDRIATIDVGTNTILLLISEMRDGKLVPLYEEQRFGRMGQGVDATKMIRRDAMERVRDALLDYKAKCAEFGVHKILMGGTSASRDAANKDQLIAFIKAETGLDFHIISGDREAEMSFTGVLAVMPELQGECVVLDIGGGSSEVIVGNATDGKILYRHSFDVGSIRLRERFFSQVPPIQSEIDAAQLFVESLFDQAPLPKPCTLPLIVVAGVGTALGLLEAKATGWHVVPKEYTTLSAATVQKWYNQVIANSPEQTLAINPDVLQGRQEVFCTSLMILNTFFREFSFESCQISEGGWRHGWAVSTT